MPHFPTFYFSLHVVGKKKNVPKISICVQEDTWYFGLTHVPIQPSRKFSSLAFSL